MGDIIKAVLESPVFKNEILPTIKTALYGAIVRAVADVLLRKDTDPAWVAEYRRLQGEYNNAQTDEARQDALRKMEDHVNRVTPG